MDITISAIEGNRQRLDGGSMFGNAPRSMWEQWMPPDKKNRVELACRSLLIETDNKKILCETGIGAFLEPKLADRYGVQDSKNHLLLENLSKIGIQDEEISHIILSHLHFDHAGGLLAPYQENDKDLKLLFPNAQYLVGTEAFQRSKRPHIRDKASFIPQLTTLLESSDRLVLIEENHSKHPLQGLIKFIFSHGHTPGQMHTLLQSRRNFVFFCGDLIPGTHWLHNAITMGYDRYPEQLINEKSKLYEEAITQNWLLFYTHDPEIVMSNCVRNAKGRICPQNAYTELKSMHI